MKAILGGKDAQGAENSRAYNPDFEIASNNFKIVNGLVLALGGGEEGVPFLLHVNLMFITPPMGGFLRFNVLSF